MEIVTVNPVGIEIVTINIATQYCEVSLSKIESIKSFKGGILCFMKYRA